VNEVVNEVVKNHLGYIYNIIYSLNFPVARSLITSSSILFVLKFQWSSFSNNLLGLVQLLHLVGLGPFVVDFQS
jgi:hypothetical protein